MNRECRKMRGDIERSCIEPLAQERQDEVDRHIARCDACRAYLEAMRRDESALGEFVRSFEPSIGRIESESVRAVARGVETEQTERTRGLRGIMQSRIPAYAAAAIVLVAVLWGLNHFTGILKGQPAFADVMAKVIKARSVTYRQVLTYEGAEQVAAKNMATDTGLIRWIHDGGCITVMDYNNGINLQMTPSSKSAFLQHEVGRRRGKGLFNYVDWIATLQNGPSGNFVGREKIDRIDANVFVVKNSEFQTVRIWTDPNTNLPLRIVWTNRHNPKLDVVEPTMTLYESDFGGEKNVSRMIIHMNSSDGLQRNSEWVYEDFKWNEELDPALFSVVPPKDYTVRESLFDVSENGEKDLVDALAAWANMAENAFPSAIADMTAEDKVRPMLIRTYDRSGDPHAELEDALAAANLLLKGLDFAQYMRANGVWHYAGAGVKLGERDTPVCWWKPEGAQKHRILYGDLRVADIDEADLPKTPR